MIHAELIYLAEQIAEVHGEKHEWVEQLRDIADEVKETEGSDGLSGFWREGQDQYIGMLKELMDAGHAAKIPAMTYSIDSFKERIISDWNYHKKNTPKKHDGDAMDEIANKYFVDRNEVNTLIGKYLRGEVDENGEKV